MDGYDNGRLDYKLGKRSDANPYKRDTYSYRQWRDGWIDEALNDAANPSSDEIIAALSNEP